jgi:antitoxin component of MazEF toxin-antitoxin module
MTTKVVRAGDRLAVEIPIEIAAQLSLAVGDRVEWSAKGPGSAEFLKRTIPDGLLEVENRIAEKVGMDEHLLAERRLAEQGDIGAQYFLGVTSKDGAESAKWLQLAAEQGDRFSMRYLGHKLIGGEGIEKSIADGYFWLLLHASSYSFKSTRQERARMPKERRELRCIGKSLTEEERSHAEVRCRNWLDAHRLTNKCFELKL